MGSPSSARWLLIFAAALLFAVHCDGAVSRTQAWSANASSVSITSTLNADLILVFAYNGSAATAPTLASGFTTLDSGVATSQGMIVGSKVSAGGDTDSGTWTGATNVVCLVYRGASIGAEIKANGSSTILNYPALTMQVTDGTSWIVGFGGARTATAGMNGSTTTLVNRTSQTTVNGLDSGTGLLSWAGENLTFTTTSRWFGVTVEIKSTAAVAQPTGRFFPFFQP
jgi:hypothetical protein